MSTRPSFFPAVCVLYTCLASDLVVVGLMCTVTGVLLLTCRNRGSRVVDVDRLILALLDEESDK